MRTEATPEQWKELYELAFEIKEMEPWRYFADALGDRKKSHCPGCGGGYL